MCGRSRCTLRPADILAPTTVPRRPRPYHRHRQVLTWCKIDEALTVQIIGKFVRPNSMYQPAYNVTPGWNLPILRRGDNPDGDEYVIHCMKWGLVPSFTEKSGKPDHYRMFNARSDSVNENASFRHLMPKNRCFVAVEGYDQILFLCFNLKTSTCEEEFEEKGAKS